MLQNEHIDNFIDYQLFEKKLNNLPKQTKTLINTINQYSYCIANQDSEFKRSLQSSDVLIPDGIGVVLAARLLTGQKFTKIAGADLHQFILEELNNKGGSCFYLGASDLTLGKIKKKLTIEYPHIRVGSYSPPFKEDFDTCDNTKMIDAVNSFNPDALFVGMTAPKQEIWATQHKKELNANLICTVGAVFDFYAETIKRPGKIWIKLGLEWLGRLVSEPTRLWKRYLYYGPLFVGLIVKQKVKTIFHKQKRSLVYTLKSYSAAA